MPATQQDLEDARNRVKQASHTAGELYSASGTFPTLVKQKLAERSVAAQPESMTKAYSNLQGSVNSVPANIRANTVSTTGGVNIDPIARQAIEARARAGIGQDYDLLGGLRNLNSQITPEAIAAAVQGIRAEAERVKGIGGMESDIMNSIQQQLQEQRLAASSAYSQYTKMQQLEEENRRKGLLQSFAELLGTPDTNTEAVLQSAISNVPEYAQDFVDLYEFFTGNKRGGINKASSSGTIELEDPYAQ